MDKLNNVQEKFGFEAEKLKALLSDKNALESRHVTTCSELKLSKSKNEELVKELKTSSVVVKNAKKDLKEESSRHEKVVFKYVEEIKALKEFKIRKCSEEKEQKRKQKKLNQKLRKVNETEEKLERANVEMDTDENKNEPAPKIDETITPSIAVSNIFDIFSEENSSDDFDFAAKNSVVTTASSEASSITTYPSTVAHWLPLSSPSPSDCLDLVSSTLDPSNPTTMELVSSTSTDSLESENQDEHSLAQKELWEFLERSSAASPPPSTTHSTQPPGDPGAASGALDLSAARSPHTANTAASSSGQWGLVKAGNQASTEQKFRNLWKCEFCEQTYNRQNTFDQVYHTLGHQKET